jgi:hypothetical protein
MEAIYKINANELDISLIKAIKSLFKGKEVTIIVSSEMDETAYLTADKTNEKHLIDNMVSEQEVRYSGEAFSAYVEKLRKRKSK